MSSPHSPPAEAGEAAPNPNTVLRLTDAVTTRTATVRIDPADAGLSVHGLLEHYVKHAPLRRLLEEGRVTEASAESLTSLQDLVYRSGDDGRLYETFPGIEVHQGDRPVASDAPVSPVRARIRDRDVALLDLVIDRTNVGYDRNWKGFHRRRWDRHASEFQSFVEDAVARDTPQADPLGEDLRMVRAVARRIWDADFENYSRFVGERAVYKTGDETVLNVVAGSGGICSEKVQALKFVTDRYGLDSEYVFAGPDIPSPVPEDRLREMLTTFDFRFSRRFMRYWQHLALLYHVDGADVLVDDTNGNIPFLFLGGAEADRLLGYDEKPALRVRMAIKSEQFYYHRVSQDIAGDLLFAMEGWIPYMDLVQVFDNELGLYIADDFMVAPIVYRSDRAYERLRREYVAACASAGAECDVTGAWELESDVGLRFTAAHEAAASKIIDAEEHLLARYDDCHGPGHSAGLVVIALQR